GPPPTAATGAPNATPPRPDATAAAATPKSPSSKQSPTPPAATPSARRTSSSSTTSSNSPPSNQPVDEVATSQAPSAAQLGSDHGLRCRCFTPRGRALHVGNVRETEVGGRV